MNELLPSLYAVPTAGWAAFLEPLRVRLRAAWVILALADDCGGIFHHAGLSAAQAAAYRREWQAGRNPADRIADVLATHEAGGVTWALGEAGVLFFVLPLNGAPVGKVERELCAGLGPHLVTIIRLERRMRALEMMAGVSERLPYGLALRQVEDQLPRLRRESLVSRRADQRGEVETGQLRETFGLTPAEARLTVLLCGGRTLAEVARESGRSVETARTHLKRVLAKTHCRRQPELVALVLRLVKA